MNAQQDSTSHDTNHSVENAGNPREFLRQKHIDYTVSVDSPEKRDTLEYAIIEHLRMSGIYWALATTEMLDAPDAMDKKAIVDWVFSCYHGDCGGFGGNIDHDPHMLYTLSAIQILAMCDAMEDERLERDKVAQYVASLQQPDGSFAGDTWGEIDTRFSYCALNCCALLNRLDAIDVDAATAFVASCRNFDGGFGAIPGGESHAGQIFCCVGALSIGKAMKYLDADLLGWWLSERQCDSGGLNGRPEKQSDVCYSWWVLSSLCMLQRVDWIDKNKLVDFILQCQDIEDGGISDRPGNMPDVFHTFFGVCGLSMLGFLAKAEVAHVAIDPVYALPVAVVKRLGLSAEIAAPPTKCPGE